MTKLNWTKNTTNRKIDHYADAIERNQSKPKKTKKDINLGIHENHNWQIVKTQTGPTRLSTTVGYCRWCCSDL